MKRIIGLLTIIAVFLLQLIQPISFADNTTHQYIINELANDKYEGRQSGTTGYQLALEYLNSQMSKSDFKSILESNDYYLKYSTSTTKLKQENVLFDGNRLQIGTDYLPFARSKSGNFNINSIYNAGAGIETDYIKNLSGAALFSWNDKSGKFPSGILDRVNIAINHGANSVIVIANGELKVSNFEHPLNGLEVPIPVIYISEKVASKYNLSTSFNLHETKTISMNIDFNIERKIGVDSADLVGAIPGKNPNKAVLWVTNVDSFGQLPNGSNFKGAKAASAAAAMMFDIADKYSQSPPELTNIFAFVGNKWNDQNGIKALAESLNWSNIVSVIDLYAMGGTGQYDRLNLNYLDKNFEEKAKAISTKSNLNLEPGNALSSQLLKFSSNILLIRDLDTWVDESITDNPQNISSTDYATGVESLLSISNKLMNQFQFKSLGVTANFPNIEKVKTYPKNYEYLGLNTTRFDLLFDEKFQSKIDLNFINSMERIYDEINFYNYYPNLKNKLKVILSTKGSQAADICARVDLLKNPEKAGGGFSSLDDGMCIYINLNNVVFNNMLLNTFSHELNHALASSQNHFSKQFELQEWQGQSHIVRHDINSGNSLKLSRDVIPALLDGDLYPGFMSNVKNYKSAIDWEWFTNGKNNPNGWQDTYHIAGSIYAFLNDQYGSFASRRAMYRNYANVREFKQNVSIDSGLNFDEFIDNWSYWMSTIGSVKIQVSAKIIEKNNSLDNFDFSILFTNYKPKSINSSSNSSNSSNSSLIAPSFQIYFDNSMTANLDFTERPIKDIKNAVLKLEQDSESYFISINFNSDLARNFVAFYPPDGIIYRASINNGVNNIRIRINKNSTLTNPIIMLNFYNTDSNSSFFGFLTSELEKSPMAIIPIVQNDNSNQSVISPAEEKISKEPIIKIIRLTCIKGKVKKVVTGTKPKCPKGFKKIISS